MAANTQGELSVGGQAKIKHPKYEVMVEEAIFALNNRQGSTRQAVAKHLAEKYRLDAAACTTHANKALKACIEKNFIESTTGDLKGKLKLSKDRKEELKKVGKKVEKRVEKMVTEQVEKATKKPPKKPSDKRSSSNSDDKENVPSTKKRPEKNYIEDEDEAVRPKRGRQQDEKERKLKKSSSASKVDDVGYEPKPAKNATGRQKSSIDDEMTKTEELTKKTVIKKGAKKKTKK